MSTMTQLDYGQVIKSSYDDGSQSLRVNVVDASSSNLNVVASYEIPYSSINGSGGSVYTVDASTAALISKVVPNEQTGVAMNFYVNGTLLFILAPGQDNEVNVNIAAGSSITIRAKGTSAPTAGSVFLTFIG